MATTYGVGSQSPTALSRPIERVFEDAQHTGEIQLSGRKLREYPKLAAKYDLVDTISTDLSKNRLGEVPKDVCTYGSMEKLNCYHNVIKSVPVALVQLQALTHLNLSSEVSNLQPSSQEADTVNIDHRCSSCQMEERAVTKLVELVDQAKLFRNQLSIIPSFISQLHQLEVLLASHNHLVSLPEEIGVLDKLMELDVSCNEISHLPMQIGDLKSLKSLNVRRNLLVELPIEISKLNLRKLDFSGNRISKIPTHFRKIETLEEIILDHNPLTLPPAYVCTKGRQHIMKFLQIEAIKEDKKRGILNDVEMKRYRKSLPPQQSVSSEEFGNFLESPENKWKRHTVLSSDSGYSTTDEKSGYSPQETSNGSAHVDEATSLAARTAAPVREPRYQPARGPLSQHWATRERISPEKPQIFPEKPQQYIVARGHNSPSLDQSRISPEKPQTPPKPQILSGKPQSYSVTRGRNSPSVEKSPISEKLPYYPPPENLPPYSVTKPHFPGAQPPMTAHPTMPHSQTQSTFTGTQHTTGQPTFNGSQHSQTQQGQPHFIGSQHTQGQPNYTGSQHTQGQSNYTGSQHTQGQPNFTGSQHTQGQPNFTGSQHTQGQPNVTGSQHQHTQEQPNLTGSQQSPRQPTLHSYHQQSQEPQIVTSPQTQYPPSPLSPQTPTTPQGPGPGAEITTGPAPSDDAFTRELQRQKYEYESKKKLAEQIRRQQEEEDEREQRRRAAQRVQDEQRALLDRQREEATHAQEQARLREEQRQHESAEATRLEEAQRLYEESQRAEEARRQEEQCLLEQRQSQEESRQHRSEHNYYHGSVNSNYNNSNSAWMPPPPPSMLAGSPTSPRSEHGPQYVAYSNSMVDPFTNYSLNNYRKPVQSSNSFKEDRRNISGPQPYRRTVSDSNQRLPVHRPPPQQSSDSLTRPSYPIKNGPIEEASVNGSPGLRTSTEPAADTSFTSDTSTPPHNDMTHINGTSVDINRPTTPQSTVVRRTKVTDRVQSAPTTSSASKVSKLTERHGRATTASTTTRTGVPSARKNHLTAEEELRRSQQSTKVCPSTDTQKVRNRADDQRLRTLQKESATSYLNRRSTGSTSSEDDKKRSTPTRSLAYSATPGKRTGAGNATQSNVPRSTTTSARTTQPTRATTNARTAGSVTTTSGAQSRRTANLGRSTISGSSSSLASNTSATSKSKRAGQVMTNAQVKALEAYKDADANYTMRRQDQGHHDGLEQLDILRKTISTRLKRTLPDNLSEALSDGVLLCHLANQIRPRSVASVHVPSPAVPKLTPAKCRRNVDNFLEACRKIGVNRDQICASSDIIEGKGVGKVAITVAALVAMATHAKHAAIV